MALTWPCSNAVLYLNTCCCFTDDDELLSNLAEGLEEEGLEGVEGVPVSADMRGGMLPREAEAVSALLSLRNV